MYIFFMKHHPVPSEDKPKYIEVPKTGIGDLSDGYHTFNELYHHRAVLFATLVNANPDLAWKSHSHHDGTMYDDMFIVGIDTPFGQVTYHYDLNPYWHIFKCKEVERAPEWDGHTPDQAIDRLLKWSLASTNEPEKTSLNIFVSCPMRDKTPEQIKDSFDHAFKTVCERYPNREVHVIDSYFGEGDFDPIECLGKSISLISDADLVVFVEGWHEARGCRIEHEVAEQYGKEILYVANP